MKKTKNIIFDLGGVVFDIDYNKTVESFRNLGIIDAGFLYSKASQITLFDDLEKGMISEKLFFDGIRTLSKSEITDLQIRNAWNALLIGIPKENEIVLRGLTKTHRLFLLSNTNSIHESAYRKMITDHYGSFILDSLFEKIYLSHNLHLRKPDPAIFMHVINDKNLNIAETLFIDDSPQHVNGAESVGIKAIHYKGKGLAEFFEKELI